MGRPSIYSAEVIESLCDKIATSGEGLKKICESNPNFPAFRTVFTWLNDADKKEFQHKYARAREAQAYLLADEIIDIADDSTNDTQLDELGIPLINHDNIQRSRLRVDARKWKASKLAPKKYGEKMEVENTGTLKFVITPKKKQDAE